jgi:hypothetical protein
MGEPPVAQEHQPRMRIRGFARASIMRGGVSGCTCEERKRIEDRGLKSPDI